MNLYEMWNLPEEEELPTPEEIKRSIYSKSKSIMEALIKGLRHKLYIALGLTILYIATAFYSDDRFLSTVFSFVAGLHLLMLLYSYGQYSRLKPEISSEFTALEEMKRVCAAVKKALRLEEIAVLTCQPVLLIASPLLGATLVGREMNELVHNTHFLMGVMAFLVVGIPLTHWLGKRMNQKAFGWYLDTLQQNISTLEKEG